MNTSLPRHRTASITCLLIASALVGCAPEPEPDLDLVIDYLRNARLIHLRTEKSDGRVRFLWSQGQEYVNKVLAIDAELQKALHPLHMLDDPQALWPRCDARWQDAPTIADQLRQLTEATAVGAVERQKLARALDHAIAALPDGLAMKDDRPAAIKQIRNALARDGVTLDTQQHPEELTRLADGYRELYAAVNECLPQFDASGVGLVFKDDACSERTDMLYDNLREQLVGRRAEYVAAVSAALLDTQRLRKQTVRDERPHGHAYLTHRRDYLRDELRNLPKRLSAHIDALREQLQAIGGEKATAANHKRAQTAACLKGQIEALQAEQAQWKAHNAPLLVDDEDDNADLPMGQTDPAESPAPAAE